MEKASKAELRVYYTPEECFQALGVGRSLGYKLLVMGKIPSVRLGLSGRRRGKFLIPRRAFDQWIEETSREAVSRAREVA